LSTEFSEVGEVDITDTASLFESAEVGRKAADEAAMVLAQWAADIEWSLSYIPTIDGKARRKARRVARHAKRAADQMTAVRESCRKVPDAFNKTYEQELAAVRNKSRKGFNIGA